MSGIQQNFAYGRSFGAAPGQQAYTTAGTYSWVALTGITSVSVVAVGGGGKGQTNPCSGYPASGSGGGLGYTNNITVVPGNSYSVVVGVGTSTTGAGTSYFCSTGVVRGGGGERSFSGCAAGGTYTGTGGGNGGKGRYCTTLAGGGGAAGYSGNGGNGYYSGCISAGAGGGGGGGYGNCGGGGVGILGQGSNGAAGTSGSRGGKGGSGGCNGTGAGGAYGGGGGPCANGAVGAVRIIWPGTTRSFPSTCTGNL